MTTEKPPENQPFQQILKIEFPDKCVVLCAGIGAPGPAPGYGMTINGTLIFSCPHGHALDVQKAVQSAKVNIVSQMGKN